MSTTEALLARADMFNAGGLLSSLMAFDFAKAVIDNEIALMLKGINRGLEFSEDNAVIYSQFLSERGRMMADVIMTRLAENHYQIATGTSFIDNDMGWIRTNLWEYEPSVEILEVTEDCACIGMWGPRPRDILQTVTEDDVSNAVFPYMTARTLSSVVLASWLSVSATWVSSAGSSTRPAIKR